MCLRSLRLRRWTEFVERLKRGLLHSHEAGIVSRRVQ
jgi:hypothetical protein